MATKTKTSNRATHVASEFRNERNSNGFFILTEKTDDFEVPDPNQDQETRITQAIEIFDNSLEKKSTERTKIYIFS